MKTPSIERLEQAFPGQAERAKEILHEHGHHWQLAMNTLNRLGDFHGVETVALGDGSFVDYLNAGDSYATTLYRWRGNYYVGDVGTLLERHGSMDLQEAIQANGFRQH